MKKLLFLAAVAATVLASCAKTVDLQKNTGQGNAIAFGVYTPKSVVTKDVSATDFGTVTTNSLGKSGNAGFGVFAYYTGNDNYASGSFYANFMYNEQVTGNGDGSSAATAWTYDPVKYWPNEHGSNAVSDDTDKLTFLAYAPWVDVKTLGTTGGSTIKDASDADATEGIFAMTGNYEKADALICFKVPASSEEQIDLLYGRLGEKSTNVDNTQQGTVGNAIENLTKQKTGGQVKILFKHALAKFAIDIKNVVDAVPAPTGNQDANTKVVVKSITLKGTGLGTQGNLNLYTGNWSAITSATSFAVSPLPDAIAVNDAPTSYPTSTITGVDEDGLDETIDIMLIPGDSATLTGIEIVYYVCTSDANLHNEVSVVENHISKDFASAINVAKGKQHNVTILLGLTSVKLTAEVEDWDTDLNGNSTDDDDIDIDLPQNVA